MSSHVGKTQHFASSEPVLTAAELEFLAEDELISIDPKFRSGVLNFLQGDFGPFRPALPTKVPLWLAISLKTKNRCTILAPDWMSVESLEGILQQERNNEVFNKELSFHYLEVASLVLTAAADDIQDADQIRTLLEDIENIRKSKIYKGVGEAASNQLQLVKVTGIGGIELMVVRSFFADALGKMYELSGKKEEAEHRRLYGTGGRGMGGGMAGDGGGGGGGGGGGAGFGDDAAAAATAASVTPGGATGGGRRLRRFR